MRWATEPVTMTNFTYMGGRHWVYKYSTISGSVLREPRDDKKNKDYDISGETAGVEAGEQSARHG